MLGLDPIAADGLRQEFVRYQELSGKAVADRLLGVDGPAAAGAQHVDVVEQSVRHRHQQVVAEFVEDGEANPSFVDVVGVDDPRLARIDLAVVVAIGGALSPGYPRTGQGLEADRAEVELDRRGRVFARPGPPGCRRRGGPVARSRSIQGWVSEPGRPPWPELPLLEDQGVGVEDATPVLLGGLTATALRRGGHAHQQLLAHGVH